MTEMIKCGRCYSKPLTDFDFNKNGVRFKMCNKCRIYDRDRRIINGDELRELERERYQINKESRLAKTKQYWLEHHDRLCATHVCECGSSFQYRNKSDHEKTNKHKQYLETQS